MTRIDAGYARFDGLITESEWSVRPFISGTFLMTTRALMSSTLKVESTAKQFPAIGTIVPVDLIPVRNRVRTGKAMTAKLATIKAKAAADRAELKELRSLKAQIV